MDFFSQWSAQIRDVDLPALKIVGRWKNEPLYQNRLYGVFHQEGQRLASLFMSNNLTRDDILIISFSGHESANEIDGLAACYAETIEVLQALLLNMHQQFSCIMIGPATAIREKEGENALESLQYFCSEMRDPQCAFVVYHSADTPSPHEPAWLNLIQYTEKILR